jgi:outer membrane protein assembly factor BamB
VVGIKGEVIAIDPEDGRIRWRNGMPQAGLGVVELLIGNGLVIAAGPGVAIHAIDYRTGETQWTATHSSAGRATMVVRGERLYVAKGGEINCFDLRGQRLWTQSLSGMGMGSVSLGFPGVVRQGDDTGNS